MSGLEKPESDSASSNEPPEGGTGEEGPEPSPGDQEALAIVDRAIEAAGGWLTLREKSDSYKATTRGKWEGHPYEMTVSWKAPDRLLIEAKDGSVRMAVVGDSCWVEAGGAVKDCGPEAANVGPETTYVTHLLGLHLLKSKDVTLSSLGADKVGSMSVKKVKVEKNNAPMPMVLSFDDEEGLLRRVEYEGHLGTQKGTVVLEAQSFFRKDGVSLPRKSTFSFNGELKVEDECLEVSFEAIEDTIFDRP